MNGLNNHMISLVSFYLSILLAVIPSSTFDCDGEVLKATIRNNLNGDFSLVNDLEIIDQGAFVVLDWKTAPSGR